MPLGSDVFRYTRIAWGLRDFLRGNISLDRSIQTISSRLHNRDKNLLSVIQKGIYRNPNSPYLKLLRLAGCEFGDIEAMVNRDGIESMLHTLLSQGVYLSYEEFKGKKEVVRNGHRLLFKERDFDNPFLPVSYLTQTTGSRSAGTRTIFDLNHQQELSYYHLPELHIHNIQDFPIGLWKSVLPASSGIGAVLRYWKVGKPVARWFSPIDESQAQSSPMHRLAMRYIIYGSRLWGVKLARSEYVHLEEAVRIAEWMANICQQHNGCILLCSPSAAVRVCNASIKNGIDIHDAYFLVSGEPLTQAKHKQIVSTGASPITKYTISEVGRVGVSCPDSKPIDDVHFADDRLAMIQHSRKIDHTDIQVDAFLLTTLLPSSPKILLNVESDDFGIMETRQCNCLLGQIGLHKHVHTIRSFAKLTGSGMTIIGSDFARILEEVLPRKYGGSPTDYQLLEEEDDDGQTRLFLIISPDVGTIDEDAVIATVWNALRKSATSGGLAAGVWNQANMLEIKRIYPISSRGKIMTLHHTRVQ